MHTFRVRDFRPRVFLARRGSSSRTDGEHAMIIGLIGVIGSIGFIGVRV